VKKIHISLYLQIVKGIVHLKMKILSSFTLLFQTIGFHWIFCPTMEVNGVHQLVTDILQNIFFCVQQKKEIHTGLKQLEGE